MQETSYWHILYCLLFLLDLSWCWSLTLTYNPYNVRIGITVWQQHRNIIYLSCKPLRKWYILWLCKAVNRKWPSCGSGQISVRQTGLPGILHPRLTYIFSLIPLYRVYRDIILEIVVDIYLCKHIMQNFNNWICLVVWASKREKKVSWLYVIGSNV